MPVTTPSGAARRALLIGIVLAITMNAFEAVAVVTAMPQVAKDLHGDSLYGAAFSSYMLANLVSPVVSGEIADRRGPASAFTLGISSFVAGLLVAGLAPSMPVVVLGRILQGFGGGTLYSVALVASGRGFPAHERPRVLAMLSTAWVLPALAGPALAGLVTEHIGWRAVFLGLLPLPPVLVALTLPPLRHLGAGEGAPASGAWLTPRMRDAFVLAAGVGLVVAGLTQARVAALIALVVAGLAVAAKPMGRLLPSGLWRAAPGVPAACLCRFTVNVAFFGTDTFIPFAASRLHGAGPLAAGMLLASGSLSWTLGSWVQARRSTTGADGPVVRVGFVVLAAGIALTTALLSPSFPYGLVVFTWLIAGFGIGLVFNATSVVALAGAEPGREGLASSQLQLSDALGFACIGSVIGALVGAGERAGWTVQGPLALGWTITAMAALIGAVVAPRVRTTAAAAAAAATASTEGADQA